MIIIIIVIIIIIIILIMIMIIIIINDDSFPSVNAYDISRLNSVFERSITLAGLSQWWRRVVEGRGERGGGKE